MLDTGEALTFRLFGGFEVACAGRPVGLPGRRARALLAMLALRVDQPVATQQLITGLWGAEPPKAAGESVRYFVHQLRQALPRSGPGRHGVLERHGGGGYVLRVPPASVDAVCFERLVRDARAATGQGDRHAAWGAYAAALGLWRGPPLADLAGEPFAGPPIVRLEELRLAAVAEQFAVGLDLGWGEHLLGELRAEVAAHPDHEGLRRLLLALEESRQPAEALGVDDAARAGLCDGAERGTRLRPTIQAGEVRRDLDPAVHPPTPVAVRRGCPLASIAPTPRALLAATRDSGASMPARSPAPRPDERKLVTVLVVAVTFVDVPAGRDPEDARASISGAGARMAEHVGRHGGVTQVVTAGWLRATFGADHTGDDDPERAVRAALDIVTDPRVAGLEEPDGGRVAVRAGVATGEAVVSYDSDGPYDGDSNAVRLAELLVRAAQPGTVLVGADTHQATRRSIRYRQVNPPSLGECPGGPAAWQALAPWPRTGNEGVVVPLVERDREIATLAEVFQRLVNDREPGTLTLIAGPGLGKTRLVTELARLAHEAGELVSLRVGSVRCWGQAPLGAITQILRAEAGIGTGDTAHQVQRKLRARVTDLLGEDAGEITRALRLLVGMGDAALSGQRLRDAAVRFLAAVATHRPLVVVLEDLQWADSALLEFATTLLERAGRVPLLLVATARPEFLDRHPDWTAGRLTTVTFTLPPLTRTGTKHLLTSLLPDRPLPGAMLDAVVDACGGNPRYVQEYAHLLAEQPPSTNTTIDTPADPVPTPTSVWQSVAAQLDTLTPHDKRLLQTAAVIGHTGFTGQLAEVSGHTRHEAHAWLLRLEPVHHRQDHRGRPPATSRYGARWCPFARRGHSRAGQPSRPPRPRNVRGRRLAVG